MVNKAVLTLRQAGSLLYVEYGVHTPYTVLSTSMPVFLVSAMRRASERARALSGLSLLLLICKYVRTEYLLTYIPRLASFTGMAWV